MLSQCLSHEHCYPNTGTVFFFSCDLYLNGMSELSSMLTGSLRSSFVGLVSSLIVHISGGACNAANQRVGFIRG